MAATGLCPTCTRVAVHTINELPRDYVDLYVALGQQDIGMTEFVHATRDLPAGLRINVAALCQEIVTQACTYAEPVAEKLGIEWDTDAIDNHTRPGWRLQRASRLLARNMPVLLALQPMPVRDWSDNGWYSTWERDTDPDGIDGALALMTLHHITRATLGQTKLVHKLPAPCPNCSGDLVRDDGDDNVHCLKCRLQWDEDDYRRLTLILASEYRVTVG